MACKEISKFDEIIKKSVLIEDVVPTRYHLTTRTDNLEKPVKYKRIIFGERDQNKPHKTILMVGETGTGKTKLINVMVNYMLDIQKEDKIWFEITDDQSDQSSAHSQTSIITVYGVYLEESEIDLTIIDTPGYGDTRGAKLDKQMAVGLLSLSESAEKIHEIHLVCLVIMAQQNRLSERQIYIFDAVQSLFGRDAIENIVLLFTHSNGGPPKNALTTVKDAKIKCAINEQNQPVYFLFDNCQSDAYDEEYEMIRAFAWNLSFKGMAELFKFLDNIKPKSLEMTQDVLKKRKQLEAIIFNLKSRVEMTNLKQNELKQTQEALEKNKENVQSNKNFEYEVEVPYKDWVNIDRSKAYEATCCTICEENCHYPGCWWVKDLSWCSAMRNYHCTVCTNKCHYTKHVKGDKIYVAKIRKEKRTFKDLEKRFHNIRSDYFSFIKKLEEELQQLEIKKAKLVIEAFHCVETLQMIALNTCSLFTLENLDFLIEQLKKTDEPEKVKILEDIKGKAK